MTHRKLRTAASQRPSANEWGNLAIGRRQILTAVLLSPLVARAQQTPCPPAGISLDGGAAVPDVTCGADSATTLRNASNTGLAGAGISESSLVAQGAITYGTSNNGQTITGKKFTGTVAVSASNFTLRGCLIEVGGGDYGVRVKGGSNFLLEDCTIRTTGSAGYTGVLTEGGSFTTVNRCNISMFENGMSLNGGTDFTLDSSYIHHTKPQSGGHTDAVEIYGGSRIVLKNSTIMDLPFSNGSTSAVNIAPWWGSTIVDECTVQDCFLDGGNMHVVVDLQSTGYIRHVRFLRNKMGGHSKPDVGGIYWALNNADGRSIVQTEAALQASPNSILWPTSGPDVNRWDYCRNGPFKADYNLTDLTPDRTGQIITP